MVLWPRTCQHFETRYVAPSATAPARGSIRPADYQLVPEASSAAAVAVVRGGLGSSRLSRLQAAARRWQLTCTIIANVSLRPVVNMSCAVPTCDTKIASTPRVM